MGSDGVPGRDSPVPTEIVHESGRTRVTRLFLPEGTVIRKQPLGPDGERRVRHETAVLERLRGVAGVAQLAGAPESPGSVVLADAGGISLASAAKPLAVAELTGLAVRLGRAVAGMHRRGVVHRDITPANIVLSGDGAACVVDFALASSSAEIRPEFTHHAEIAGTLAYLAPEATGRTGRPADQRADLYALGAVLYELATGAPPFGSGDPLRLVHDHLARVPTPPAEVNPALPGPVSEIILHLLEKEPDRRYQTADGLIYDLERAQAGDRWATGFRVGGHDVPERLLQPSRLAGRGGEVAVLEAALEETLTGQCGGVLVSGAPGVGKTALADQLRPVVTARAGWFVAGKFDQYRRDLEFDALNRALRALGRLLLAEPDDELAGIRERVVEALGPNAGLVTATVPEFATLLAVPPDPGDPLTTQTRSQQAAARVLRAVASRKRPVVLFVDDLQWAGRTSLGFVDLVLSEEPVQGLLLVGAYREDDVDASHPMSALLPRWRGEARVRHLRLANLPVPAMVTMVAEMLHVGGPAAAGLAEAMAPCTSGNPYETVELLNALRRAGALTTTAAGWQWDGAAVRAHLNKSQVAGLLKARVAALPERSWQVVEPMACLGGRAELGVLEAATGEQPGALEQMLAPALEEGLLVAEPGAHPSVRFRHDRIREVILRGLDPSRRRLLQLAMARRLAAVPELFAVAAEQYLPVVGAVDDPAERPAVVGLLRRAAGQASLTGDYALAEALLAAEISLIDPGETALLAEAHAGHHAALYGLGRLEEADEEYRTIERLCPRALDRADATAVQARSLTHRARFADAIALGIESLRELGAAVPAADRLRGEVDRQLEDVYRWLDHTEVAAELLRPEIGDPALLAEGRLLSAMVPAAYFSGDVITFAWLTLEALRIWIDDGPGPTLVGPASYVATATAALRGDYARAYQAARRILALAEAHGYEPATSEARMAFCIYACWCEPVETDVHESRRAREGLIAGGNLSFAGYTYYQSVTDLLDCAPSLDLHIAEAEAALAFLRRTGDEQTIAMLEGYRWLAGALSDEGAAAATETAPAVDRYAGNPPALFNAHFTRAVAAAIFGDPGALTRHTAAAMPLLPTALGLYVAAVARALRALALAAQARDSDGDERAGLLAELDDVTGWLAARAADAPDNFLHLLRLAEAERAWTAGDFRAAGLAFDAAQREAAQRQRPWHRALIAEHAARFYLAHGFDHAGHDLLAQARQHYLAWGATAKVSQLDWAYPALRPASDAAEGDASDRLADFAGRRSTVTAGTMELLGIVSASQALSSETSIARLPARVAEVLSAMTGATGVQLLLWSEERHGWLRPAAGGRAVPVGGASRERTVPMSVLRYAERTREPLVVADAAGDERFARDPYFAGSGCCSLLVVPVLSRGMLQAVLVLENRLLSGAFTAQRLETVRLIAGQLAVSLDNAQLYADFRQIADEQAALRRVAVLVARAAPPEEVFAAVAGEAGQVLGVDVTILNRYSPGDAEAVAVAVWACDGVPPVVVGNRVPLGGRNMTSLMFRVGQPARIDSYTDTSGPVGGIAREAGVRASVGVPVSVAGELWGVMIAASRSEPLPGGTEARLAGFTELAATAVANAEAQAEVSASRARIVAAADQARRRIERNLHDGAQQRLVSLGLRLRAVQAAVPRQFAVQLDDAVTEAAGALDELGEIARGIHPAVLAERGLAPALKTLARRSAVPVDLQVHVEQRLPEPVEVSAYYVIAEALSNAAKHARATTVTVQTKVAGDVLFLTVRDDGVGGAGFTRGTGLDGLKDRVEALGGRIFLDSPRGAGTSLRVELPLTPATGA